MNVITNTTVLPEQFESAGEAADFWDKHSLVDYWDQIHEVEIEVRARRRRRVMLDPDVWEKVVSRARIRGVSPETLVNLWLMERVQAQVTFPKAPPACPRAFGACWPRF